MILFAILLFGGTMALSLWATMRVRQVYGKFSQLPASSGSSGAQTAATILRQEGIYDVEIVEHDEPLGDHYDPIHKRLVLSRGSRWTQRVINTLTEKYNWKGPRTYETQIKINGTAC